MASGFDGKKNQTSPSNHLNISSPRKIRVVLKSSATWLPFLCALQYIILPPAGRHLIKRSLLSATLIRYMLILEFNIGKIILLFICLIYTIHYCPDTHCGRQDKASLHKYDHIQIPRTCECVTLYSKKDSADMISLRIWGSKNHLGLSKWAQ